MKEIKIKKITLRNFKCHAYLALELDGRNAALFGDNATGKSSVYDALTWLLFGKDSRGNGEKNIEIKPLDERGEVKDHGAVTEVEALLSVNGEELMLRRTLAEVWTTKRGHSEPCFEGNVSEYFVDGVPVKKYAFTEKVDELVSEGVFKMLTSVSYFASELSWQERRRVLFTVAGTLGDDEIMATDERFERLAAEKKHLCVEDFKKKLLVEKKGLVGAKNDIPARISECERTVEEVAAIDFDAYRAELEKLNKAKAELEAEKLSLERSTAADEKRMALREAQLDMVALENENKAYRAAQQSAAPSAEELIGERARLEADRAQKSVMLEAKKHTIDELDEQIAACRERWISVNAEVFGGGTCAACGQALPAAALKRAREAFEAAKQRRLDEAKESADVLKAARAQTEVAVAELNEALYTISARASALLEREKAACAQQVKITDMEGYAEKRAAIKDRISALNEAIGEITTGAVGMRARVVSELASVGARINECAAVLSKESLIAYSRERIDRLRADAAATAEKLDRIEELLWLVDEFGRYKTRFVEDSVNRMFRVARFRLYREQISGGLEDRCDVVLDGVPYINVNSGAKINVGIDIINTLSRAYGVSVPLFIDNAESVTAIEKHDGQMIRLVVSENDKELRCEYEG
ncbi:MAG: AAA family ATPase [Clostridia bacterium]|nr:AAA family ATPase [Clostridia bacterium]